MIGSVTRRAVALIGDRFAVAHDRGRRLDPPAAILRLSPGSVTDLVSAS
jgi:hypothetical protein